MTSATATVETLSAEVRVLTVGRRQVTMGVFRQLDTVDWTEQKTLELFGRVRETRKDEKDLLHVVGRVKDTGVLVRSRINPREERFGEPSERPGFWISYREGTHWKTTFNHPRALREMRSDLISPVRFHYGMPESERLEIEEAVNLHRMRLADLEDVKDRAYASRYCDEAYKLPKPESEVLEEAYVKASKDYKAQKARTDSHKDWLKPKESKNYIDKVLEELDLAAKEIELSDFGMATIAEWEKLNLIVLAGLT
jgi:hypothetical protein